MVRVLVGAGWLLVGVVGLVGCELALKEAGGKCNRSAQCAPGLACVEGRCSDDLSALGDLATVPDLLAEPDEDAGGG